MHANVSRVLYFSPEFPASTSGVLHSTVLAEASFLNKHGIESFFIGTDIDSKAASDAEELIKRTYGIQSKVFGFHSMKYGVLSSYYLASRTIYASKTTIQEFNPTHLWTDSFVNSLICRTYARNNGIISVFDVQGVRAAEAKLEHDNRLRSSIIGFLEKNEYKKSAKIATVSHKLKTYIKDVSGRDDTYVIPCCFDKERFYFDNASRVRIRNMFRFTDDEVIICYSGGLSKWQRITDIVELCSKISIKLKRIKFLFLTRDVEKLKGMATERNLSMDRCAFKSCLQHEISQYLSAADIAIIMRDDIPVNNVASPIKIGEYLSCGLPVILTKGIGDYSEMIQEAKVGLLLDEKNNKIEQIANFVSSNNLLELRERAIAFAREKISWEAYLSDLKNLFNIKSL